MPGLYAEPIKIVGGNAVSIVGDGATIHSNNVPNYMLEPSAGANVTVRGANFEGQSPLYCHDSTTVMALRDVTMHCPDQALIDSCHAVLLRVDVEPTLNAYNAYLSVDRSTFIGTGLNDGLALAGTGGSNVKVTNSIMSNLGVGETGPNTVDVSYSTIYGRSGVSNNGSATMAGVTFRNDIIVATTVSSSVLLSARHAPLPTT